MTRQGWEWGAVVGLAGCLGVLLVGTYRWPLISDAVLMHYIVLLMGHGMAPYRDIVDVNMPGSYLVDVAVTKLLGVGAVGWRLFDYGLMGVAGMAIAASAGRRNGLAGAMGGLLFAITHVADGVAQGGQRDFVVAVLLVAGFAVLVGGEWSGTMHEAGTGWRCLRTSTSGCFVFGLCCGAAGTIKPPALIFAVLLVAAAMESRGAGRGVQLRRLGGGVAGLLAPVAVAGAWLARMGSLGSFIGTARGLVVYHAGMARHTLGFLLVHAAPSQVLPVVGIGVALMFASRGWRRGEQRLVLLAMGCGLVSFCAQGKAYPYHRYPLLAFVWVFIAMQVGEALAEWRVAGSSAGGRSAGGPRLPAVLGWTVVAYCVLWLGPASTARALRYDWGSQPSLDLLQADLREVAARSSAAALTGASPAQRLDRQVQCMDTMAGCITVLDRMGLVQSTGFLYDCYFFAPGVSAVKAALQKQFLAQISHAPPAVFVVTDQWCLDLPGGYRKLEQWPEFAGYLAEHYQMAEQRSWPGGGSRRHLATLPFGYRVYVRD